MGAAGGRTAGRARVVGAGVGEGSESERGLEG